MQKVLCHHSVPQDCGLRQRCVASFQEVLWGIRLKDHVMHQQFKELLLKVRENEEKLVKFGQLEQQLVAARTLGQLLGVLLQTFPVGFSLDAVRLVLLDRDAEWQRALGSEAVRRFAASGLDLRDNLSVCAACYAPGFRPVLGPYLHALHGDLFVGLDQPPGSVALLPLVRQGGLIGGLHLVSYNPSRFTPEDGTYFLERMASFVLMCLENALYYEKVERSGWLDGLTQVNNRRYFDVRLAEAVSHALRHDQALSLIMFDLDFFKQVNDRWGHQAGDLVLQQAAQIIRAQLRGSDSFARYGGEEFVALLPEASQAAAAEIAQRVRVAVGSFAFQTGQVTPVRMTISIGVAQQERGGMADVDTRASELLGAADAALYRAKAQGRNRVVLAA